MNPLVSAIMLVWCVIMLVFGVIGNADAALIDRGGGLIYDSDQNITWLQDANYGAGSVYDDGDSTTDGRMTWANAVAWAENLIFYDSVRSIYLENWRLPDIAPANGLSWDMTFSYDGSTDFGFNITRDSTEMAHLFHVTLGNSSQFNIQGESLLEYGLQNTSYFSNLQNYTYWSYIWAAVENGGPGAPLGFHFDTGLQDDGYRMNQCYAWAVMDGDVAPVPIPAAAWFLSSGLFCIIGLRKKFWKMSAFLFPVLFVFGIAGNVNAALIDRGGGLIYDSDQNITWLQDANYAMTSGYHSDGYMTWDEAIAWADGLEYYDEVRDVTWDDWRLPITVDGPFLRGFDGTTTGGYNIITSEMGYMYYVNLGNLSYYALDGTYPQPGWGLNNTGPFNNIEREYWSCTQYGVYPDWPVYYFDYAWFIYTDSGGHFISGKASNKCAWAVRDGDVSAVPIPGAVWLLGSGLIGLVGFREWIQSNSTFRASILRLRYEIKK